MFEGQEREVVMVTNKRDEIWDGISKHNQPSVALSLSKKRSVEGQCFLSTITFLD